MANGDIVIIDDDRARLSDHLTPEEQAFLVAFMTLAKLKSIGFSTALAIVWGVESVDVGDGAKSAD